ncbi:hypothetical protein Tco_0120781 [Tanacetum coccineum]
MGDKLWASLLMVGNRILNRKTFLACVIGTIVSPVGHLWQAFENVYSSLAPGTQRYHLISTDLKQEGIIPEIMLDILEEFILLLGHSLDNEFPVCLERCICGEILSSFLSRTSMSNSWSNRIHRMSLALASFLAKRYLIAEMVQLGNACFFLPEDCPMAKSLDRTSVQRAVRVGEQLRSGASVIFF